MRFTNNNMLLANCYHNGYIEHCLEQIKKTEYFFKKIKLKYIYGLASTII